MRTLCAALLIALAVGLLGLATEDFNVYFIDVGHGDAILIDYTDCEMLIDGGGGKACATFLDQCNCIDGALEILVATHPDADHIGGLDDVLHAYDVLEVVTNGVTASTDAYSNFNIAVLDEECAQSVATRAQRFQLRDLTFQVLNPDGLTGKGNDDSIVLLLTYGTVSFLFTGDVEDLPDDCDTAWSIPLGVLVLKAPHHGRTNSATLALADTFHPDLTIISTDDCIPETATGLLNRGCPFIATSTSGTVHLRTDGQTVWITTDALQGHSASCLPEDQASD